MARKKLIVYLTKDEVRRLLSQPDKRTLGGLRDFCVLRLMLVTGLRRAEVCSVDRSAFKVEAGLTRLYLTGKGNKEAAIPINDKKLLSALTRYWNFTQIKYTPDLPAFVTLRTKEGESPRRITNKVVRTIVDKHSKKAGIAKRVTPHTMRHSFLTAAYRETKDLLLVQKLARHASLSSTTIYLHLEDSEIVDFLKDFSYDG